MNKSEIILKALDQMYPDATVELTHSNNFELLIAVILSAQTTDVAVNKVTPELFNKYPTVCELANAKLEDVENILKTIGLYKNKAKNIIKTAKILCLDHNSIVPNSREILESLPGVGRKTANVVLSNAFGVPLIAVDTHVARVSKRLGLAKESDDVLKIEQKLYKKFKPERYTKLHHQLIFFGRYHCLAKKPKCYECPLVDICVYKNKNFSK